jgi:hypothetical protein
MDRAKLQKLQGSPAAYAFVDEMVSRADGMIDGVYPYWHGWALRAAFAAGQLDAAERIADLERENRKMLEALEQA